MSLAGGEGHERRWRNPLHVHGVWRGPGVTARPLARRAATACATRTPARDNARAAWPRLRFRSAGPRGAAVVGSHACAPWRRHCALPPREGPKLRLNLSVYPLPKSRIRQENTKPDSFLSSLGRVGGSARSPRLGVLRNRLPRPPMLGAEPRRAGTLGGNCRASDAPGSTGRLVGALGLVCLARNDMPAAPVPCQRHFRSGASTRRHRTGAGVASCERGGRRRARTASAKPPARARESVATPCRLAAHAPRPERAPGAHASACRRAKRESPCGSDRTCRGQCKR